MNKDIPRFDYECQSCESVFHSMDKPWQGTVCPKCDGHLIPLSLKKQCDHLYREFRTESLNGKVSEIYFYCQRCLDVQIKDLYGKTT